MYSYMAGIKRWEVMQKVSFDHAPQDGFYKLLVEKIDAYFKTNNISRKANWVFAVKIISYFLIDVLIYLLILSGRFEGISLVLLFIIFGIFNSIFIFSKFIKIYIYDIVYIKNKHIIK